MNNNELKTFLEEYKKVLKTNKFMEDAVRIASSKVKIEEENSNKLLVYVGSYKVEKFVTGAKELLTYDGDPKAKYKRYIDAETGTQYNINMDEVDDFEENHNVIYREVVMNTYSLYYQNYLDVRYQLFNGLIVDEQDKVVKKLVNLSEK